MRFRHAASINNWTAAECGNASPLDVKPASAYSVSIPRRDSSGPPGGLLATLLSARAQELPTVAGQGAFGRIEKLSSRVAGL